MAIHREKCRTIVAALSFFAVLFPSVVFSAGEFKKFAVIVPVYRELYNQNIGALITSLYRQNLEGLPFQKLDVWFVVNNTADASPDVRAENQETVDFLKALGAGRKPRVQPQHQILRAAIEAPVTEKIAIHVVDLTTPGRRQRNIGAVRDLGVKRFLASIGSEAPEKILLAHLDADTGFASDYVRNVVEVFEHRNLKFALMTMYYEDQMDSEARVYKRKITTDYLIAAYSFRLAYDGDMPYGGGPRIVTTARALIDVGGVPYETVGEDTELIKRLKARFPGEGGFVENPVFAKFRAREDGYDAAIYQQQLDRPIEFGKYELETTPLLNETLASFQKDPVLRSLYEESLTQHLREATASVETLKAAVRRLIGELANKSKTPLDSAMDVPVLVQNPWFRELMTEKIKLYGADETRIFADLRSEFPYYFSDPLLEVSRTIASLRAATLTLLHRANLKDPAAGFSYLPLLRNRFPKTEERVRAKACAALFRPGLN